MLVGLAGLGSFSARFSALAGESPVAYQRRWAARGTPHVPGCYLFMSGVLARSERSDGPATARAAGS